MKRIPLASIILVTALGTSAASADDLLYFEASAGFVTGNFGAYESTARYGENESHFDRFSPSLAVGLQLSPRFAIELGLNSYGRYTFDNVYAYSIGSITEYQNDVLNEKLSSATVGLACTIPFSRKWSLLVTPNLGYQTLRQSVYYRQWYTIPFSLAQVVPDPTSNSFHFSMPEFTVRLSYSFANHISALAGLRVLESPNKTILRLSSGMRAQW
jgi:hypothetical protein